MNIALNVTVESSVVSFERTNEVFAEFCDLLYFVEELRVREINDHH